MKNSKLFLLAGVILMLPLTLKAQEADQGPEFNIGADIFSNYVWRGTKFGTGPAVQPNISLSSDVFTIGVWGSFDASGYSEADPYLYFSFPFGLTLGLTDYYYPGLSLFDATKENGSHALELNLNYTLAGLGLSANYIINEAGGAGSKGSDLYFQAGYDFEYFSLFAGTGNGWHTSDGEFDICNIGIGTSKEISVTETFSIPVKGQIILNPDREQLTLVAGFSF